VINQVFAERYFHGVDPIGRHISFDTRRVWTKTAPAPDDREVVGVVADGVLSDVREKAVPRIYPAVEPGQRSVAFYVRTVMPPASLAAAVRNLLRTQAPDAALGDLRSLAGQRDLLLRKERLLDRFSLILGLLAALIAGVGLYGVVNLAVARQMRDLVVRIALGARRRDIAGFACRDAARAVSLGMVAGLAAAVPATMLLESFLYGVEPGDPAVLAAAAILLLGIAAAACGVPVRRALAADPAAVLRQE
jgi:predicted lysophospholipase L1 biosynthesis ABC-type transport system permease subunit